MDFLPLFFRLKNKPCLIVGGGNVALRKATLLVKAGATVNVIAKEILPDLQTLVLSSCGEFRYADYSPEDLTGQILVIAATDSQQINRQVSVDAQQANIPVNVVDDPELCSVILPAIIDRSPMVIAVSSGGQSPVLVRMLRTKIESMIPAAYGQLAVLLGEFRDQVKARFKHIDERKNFWEDTLEGPVAELVFAGKQQAAKEALIRKLEASNDEPQRGEVYLVGAGPGDPDLLTFKALRLMQKADVVLYDRLVADPILDMTRRDAQRIYVGKARSDHTLPQESINQLLVSLAKQGKRVLRLKGGDPFIFGRGGEEIEELASHQIPFQVVPGITAASGCAAYSGIPLTHRDYAQSVRFITGHLKNNSCDLNWTDLVQPNQTLVFYMGLVGLVQICQQLIAHGMSENTPIALIQQGTTANHRVFVATLATMVERIASEDIKPPTLIIVGEVVKLREKLAWFEAYNG